MSDAMILPLNTTHYSYELENYLDKYVGPLPRPAVRLTCASHRVESTASSLSLDVDLSSLRKSIHLLQVKSLELDAEKDIAEHELTRLIQKWKRRHSRRMRFRRHVKKIVCRMAKLVGLGSRKCNHRSQELSAVTVGGKVVKPRVGRLGSLLQGHCEGRLAYGYEHLS
jgi:N-acetylated-alpha-linked acidic dipeptidase